jgi:hypothetical protein
VEAIRRILDSLDLTTDPEFETAWIDGPIRLCLKEGVLTNPPDSLASRFSSEEDEPDLGEIVLEGTPSAVQQAEEQSEAAPTSAEPDTPKSTEPSETSSIEDPTFRIGSLPAANRKLVVVN